MVLPEFKFTFSDFFVYIMSEECYTNNNTFYIDYQQKVHQVEADSYVAYMGIITSLINNNYTLKIEGFEEILNYKKATVHVFYNSAGSPSFKEHKDPVDVVIEVKDGVKNLIIDGWPISITPGDHYVIDKNVPHYATNEHRGLIFSYGMHPIE